MKTLLLPVLLVASAVLPPRGAQDEEDVDYAKHLAPIAVFAGEHRGQGRSPGGGFRERWHGEWINGKTALMLRTESRIGPMTAFADVRIFTWDRDRKRIRVRQFAQGGVCTYDVEVGDGGKSVVLRQVEAEGLHRAEWRYTFSFARGEHENQVHYRLDRKAEGGFQRYVRGRLVLKSD